jgi:beta-lactamase superfamily II metal-dependent hydrolase
MKVILKVESSPMRNSHTSLLRLLILICGLLLVTPGLYAQELTYFALQREGQASVAVDKSKKAAYIIDLGRGGDGDQMKLDNLPLLDRLEQSGIEDLFFVCSHPHSDHMGGIRALFRQPRLFFRDEQLTNPRFKSITIVDDGVANNLYLMLQRALAGNRRIKVTHLSATNRNAFAGISSKADEVYVETLPYPTALRPSVHGKAVITYIILGQQNSIIDFDDADSATIKKVVESLKARGITKIRAFVVPHHGSKYHEIAPILELRP